MIIPEGALPHLPVRLPGFETAAGAKLDSLRAENNGFAFHFGDSSAVVRVAPNFVDTETNLIENGTFATNDLTGWADISLGTGTVNASTGAARLTGTDASNRGWLNTSFSTEVGKKYVVTFEVTADAGGIVSLGVGTSSGQVGLLDFATADVGIYEKTFVASAVVSHVNFRTTGVTDITIDNISGKLAPIDNQNGDVNSVLTYTSPSTKNIFNQLGVLESGTTIRCDHDPATLTNSTTSLTLSNSLLGQEVTLTVTGDGYGPNLVTNGTFDTDLAGWTQVGNDGSNYWEWNSGKARCVSAGSFSQLNQTILTSGVAYSIGVDATIVSGNLKFASTESGLYNDIFATLSSGSNQKSFVALGAKLIMGRSSGVTDVSVDNITVRALIPYEVGQTVRISDTSNSTTNYAIGVVTAISGDQVTVRIESVEGSGTISDWTLIRALGALIESAATNIVPYSYIDATANWSGASDFTLLSVDSIFSGGSAYKHTNKGTAGSRSRADFALTVATSTDYRYSIIVENVDAEFTTFGCRAAGSWLGLATYTWATGIIADGGGATNLIAKKLKTVGPNGGELVRLSFNFNTGAQAALDVYVYPSGATQNTKALIIHHVQLEAGTVDTSPIITTGTAVTRAADDISELIANLPWSEDVMCLMGCFTPRVPAILNTAWGAYLSSTNRITYAAFTISHPYINDGGATLNMDAGTVLAGAENKFAVRLKDNDLATVLNGGSAVAYASGSVPTGLTSLVLGGVNPGGTAQLNGHFLWFKGVPRDISNSDLEAEVA